MRYLWPLFFSPSPLRALWNCDGDFIRRWFLDRPRPTAESRLLILLPVFLSILEHDC